MIPAKSILPFVLPALAAMITPAAVGQSRSPVTIVDSLGRKIVVPGRVERIISLEPEVTRIIVALGEGKRLVGIDFFLRHHDRLFPLVFPSSERLPVVSNQGQDLNYEEAIRLRPDILFSSPSEFRMTESIERKMKRPVVALASMGRFRDLLAEIETLGRILGREERAAELVSFFGSRMGSVRGIGPVRAADAGPSVYLSFWGSLLRTPVSYEPVGAAGGNNLASRLLPSYLGTAGATVSLEQILVWDPEVILVQGNYPPAERQVTVEGILGDPRLASVRAVRAGRVHYTFGFWYWWDPALVLVETAYLARLFHPGSFPNFDLTREGDAIFKEFYGVEGLFSALCRVLECHEWNPE
jgi:ABC-type Fe3+-hydroxamate transport system substrate-binding protein